MPARRILTFTILSAFLLLALSGGAAAHASANSADGKVRVTWGLQSEPGYTHEKNRLDLIIRDVETGAGIGGISAESLDVTLRYGEEEYDLGDITSYRGAKSSGAFAGPGNYTSGNFVYLTRPGIYALVVKGTIEGSEIDLEIPAAHEYEPMSNIMFPEAIELGGAAGGADVSALEARIAALEAKAATQSQTPATLTPQSPPTNDAPAAGVLIASLAAVAAALAMRRK